MVQLLLPQTWRGFAARLLVAGLLVANDVAFWAWRSDKPPGDPGGPLRPMGGWVMAWEVSMHTSPMLIFPCLASAGLFLWRRQHAREGVGHGSR